MKEYNRVFEFDFEIKRKTNGFEISDKLNHNINLFIEFIAFNFDNIKFIDLFYFLDKLVMVKVKLKNDDYATFHITENRIALQGYACTRDEYFIFTKATANDELYNGVINI